MATYHFQAKVIGRSSGRSVVAAAAYRAAEALHDAELGRTFNYLGKPGVVHSEIMLPAGAPSRWRDRETLWNEVAARDPASENDARRVPDDPDATGRKRRRDRQLAREIEISLPRELGQAEAIALARDFVREQFVARGMVADLNVHWGVAADGEAQPHAHVLLTLRRIDTTNGRGGLADGGRRRDGEIDARRGARRAPEHAGDPGAAARGGGDGRSDRGDPRHVGPDRDAAAGDDASAREHRAPAGGRSGFGRIARLVAAARLRLGFKRRAAQLDEHAGFGLKERAWNDRRLLRDWRERWAEMANARLLVAGHDARIDHRSYADQGITLEPQNKIGPAGARRDARGEDAERAAEHRAIARRNGERLLNEPRLALEALTRQQSTFTRQDLARLVSRQSDGAEQFAAIMAKVEASSELVRVGKDGRNRVRFSTREMVGIEGEMMQAAVALNRRTTHRIGDKRRLTAVSGQRASLSEEQALAYLHVTRSRDLAVVVGIAGGGKSTMLGAARQAWQGQGYRVRGAALSGIAAEGLEGSAAIESRTIASWEYAWASGKELLTAKDVLVVDEAGMIGSRQLGRLLERARMAGAKVVLVGDAEQLQAIEAGAAFRAIADQVGVIAITEPRRQREAWQRAATKELATARTAAALDRYEAAGMVHRHETREAARAGVIEAWNAARRRSPDASRIILAHERVDVRALNNAARMVRREAGELGVDHLVPTEGGERLLAEGDRIYFLRNERGLGVKNGTLGTLARIEGERLTVRLDGASGAGTGRAVTFGLGDYADIDHGYAATVHKTQGVTVDHAHVLVTPGMDRHLAYVALSRHRQAAQLHWAADQFDTPERLRERLGRERAKDTTLDYDEAHPVAACAEWRGLHPLVPSEIVMRREPVRAAGENDGYRIEDLEVLKDTVSPRQRPRDHVVVPPDASSGEGIEAPVAGEPTPESPPQAEPEGFPGGKSSALDQLMSALAAHAAPRWDPRPHTPIADRSARFEAALAHERRVREVPPMLPAKPYEPVPEEEVRQRAADFLARRDAEEPDALTPLLAKVYRDPAAARGRLDQLREEHGDEAVAAALTQQGPALLGPRRGRRGIFASEAARDERDLADHFATRIPDAVLAPGRQRVEMERFFRNGMEQDRRRDTIAVPGLTAEARAAIETLRKAGVDAGSWSRRDVPVERLAPDEIARAGQVAAAWTTIAADRPVHDELERFREAAEQRLGGRHGLIGEGNPTQALALAGTLGRAQQLVEQHVQIEAARETSRRAEAQRREAEAKAAEAARLQAEQRAAREKEWAARHRPGMSRRPSSGPSM